MILSDDVTTEDGTGVVHMAPAYGEADALACNAAGIPTVLTVDEQARFTPVVTDFAGQHVFDANPGITAKLREQGNLVRRETYTHSYPHCWRCRNPLIYKAVSSWFVAVTTFRDRMVELNEQITWVPEHVKHGSFGKWLANARDWSISRNRFWGSPIPVWQSDDPAYPRTDVYGSLDELERDFGVRPDDLHRPGIDELVRPNPDDPTGKSMMRRVPEVLDCWFESGSMPFAQVHYPFENREWFDSHYPGDFIVEYIGADPRLVLHAARAGHRAVRPARLPLLREPRHRARQRRPEDVQEPAQLPGRERGVRHVRLGRDALVPDGQPGAARRRTWSSPSRASGRRSGRPSCRCGTPGTSSRCTPTPRRIRRPVRYRPSTSWTGTSWPRPVRR